MRIDDFKVRDDLLFSIPPDKHDNDSLTAILKQHPEVQFVSLMGVDIAGNDTDEKIPVNRFLEHIESYLTHGVQTDGSSVVLPSIATINDAQIDLIADLQVNWYVDYNYENIDPQTNKPWGTLRIPAFLVHNGQMVCARATLKRALDQVNDVFFSALSSRPDLFSGLDIPLQSIEAFELTAATELEFWVRTPDDIINREHLSTSQTLKEQYWKRTKGIVRSALEQTLKLMELYGFAPEMGHKEVGGVKAHLRESGTMDHILEQLEIDWQYTSGLQAADNELFIRILTKEIFRLHGLEASFMAKPIPGVAGNGEHTHVNYVAVLKDKTKLNLFAAKDMSKDYLSVIGWGALMGLLKHYQPLVAPFISASIDAFNRLKPGFEAPTHVSVSIGRSPAEPSRNRTVLICLVRNEHAPQATRFELRAPNPHSNLYFVMAASSQAMLDGVAYVIRDVRSEKELEAELTKDGDSTGTYLSSDRIYRTEDDIFTLYTEDERDRYFGKPATTVYETLRHLIESADHHVLFEGGVFSDRLLRAYTKAMLDAWELELKDRILMQNLEQIRDIRPAFNETSFDERNWREIDRIRKTLAKTDSINESLFDQIRGALDRRDLYQASMLHAKMDQLMETLDTLYDRYEKNQIERF